MGFGEVWKAVVADFVERHSPGGLKFSINDGGARPDTVSLRLAQARPADGGGRPMTADAVPRPRSAELVRGVGARPASGCCSIRAASSSSSGRSARGQPASARCSTFPSSSTTASSSAAARLDGAPVFVAAQEGRFMGGAFGEVHGAKLTGLLRAARDIEVDAGPDPVRHRRCAPAGGQCRRARDRRDHARDRRGADAPACRSSA